MKLYATVQSERATKGQGGNKKIEISLSIPFAGEFKSLGEIWFEFDEILREYSLKFFPNKTGKLENPENLGEWDCFGTFLEGYINNIKGEKQKGEKCYCDCEMSIPHYH